MMRPTSPVSTANTPEESQTASHPEPGILDHLKHLGPMVRPNAPASTSLVEPSRFTVTTTQERRNLPGGWEGLFRRLDERTPSLISKPLSTLQNFERKHPKSSKYLKIAAFVGLMFTPVGLPGALLVFGSYAAARHIAPGMLNTGIDIYNGLLRTSNKIANKFRAFAGRPEVTLTDAVGNPDRPLLNHGRNIGVDRQQPQPRPQMARDPQLQMDPQPQFPPAPQFARASQASNFPPPPPPRSPNYQPIHGRQPTNRLPLTDMAAPNPHDVRPDIRPPGGYYQAPPNARETPLTPLGFDTRNPNAGRTTDPNTAASMLLGAAERNETLRGMVARAKREARNPVEALNRLTEMAEPGRNGEIGTGDILRATWASELSNNTTGTAKGYFDFIENHSAGVAGMGGPGQPFSARTGNFVTSTKDFAQNIGQTFETTAARGQGLD